MGVTGSTPPSPTPISPPKFTQSDKVFLIKVFSGLAARGNGKYINKKTFLTFFNDFPGMIGERMFCLFDIHRRGEITCEDFIGGLGNYLNGTVDEKIYYLFKVYDLEGTGNVSHGNLVTILSSLLHVPQFIPGIKDVDHCHHHEEESHDKRGTTSPAKRSSPLSPRQPEPQDMAYFYRYDDDDDGHNCPDHYADPPQFDENVPGCVPACQRMMVLGVAQKAFANCNLNIERDEMSLQCFTNWMKRNPDVLADLEMSLTKHLWNRTMHGNVSRVRRRPLIRERAGSASTVHEEPTDERVDKMGIMYFEEHVCGECGKFHVYKDNKLIPRCVLLRDNFLYISRTADNPTTCLSECHVIFLEGLYIEKANQVILENQTYFGLQLPGSAWKCGIRRLYTTSQESQEEWLLCMRTSAKTFPYTDFYSLGAQIGHGKFAQVHLATHKETGHKYAVKIIKKRNVEDEEPLRAEIAILKLVNHPHVVSMKEIFEDPQQISIVMPLIGGDLYEALVKHKSFSEKKTKLMVSQIVSALSYLHCRGIVHRDLKPENILLENEECNHLYIADFGLSRFANPEHVFTNAVGTLSYLAPEVLLCRGYGHSVDLWGVGVITYLLLAGKLPFRGRSKADIIEKILKEEVDCSVLKVSPQAEDFIRQLLIKDPKQRATLQEARDHNWFCNDDRTTVSRQSSVDTSAGNTPQVGPIAHPGIYESSSMMQGNNKENEVRRWEESMVSADMDSLFERRFALESFEEVDQQENKTIVSVSSGTTESTSVGSSATKVTTSSERSSDKPEDVSQMNSLGSKRSKPISILSKMGKDDFRMKRFREVSFVGSATSLELGTSPYWREPSSLDADKISLLLGQTPT